MSDSPNLIKQSQERRFSAHNTLLHIARLELEVSKAGSVDEFNHAFTSLTLSALAVEALANAVGERVVPDWKDFESASPFAKLRLLAERLLVPFAGGAEPWQTIRWLCRFRNLVAHAKPELVIRDEILSQEEHELRGGAAPLSKLELLVTEANARRAFNAVEAIKYSLYDGVPPGERFGLAHDAWLNSSELHDGA